MSQKDFHMNVFSSFIHKSPLKQIKFPPTVEKINFNMFKHCWGKKNISAPDVSQVYGLSEFEEGTRLEEAGERS